MRFFLLTTLGTLPVLLLLHLVLDQGLARAWPARDRLAGDLAAITPGRRLVTRAFVRPRPDPVPILAVALLLALVLGLGVDALHEDGGTAPLFGAFDQAISGWAREGRTTALDPLVVAITSFGDTVTLTAATIALVVVLGVQRSLRLAIGVAATMIAARLMVSGLKPLIGIDRPSDLYQGVEAFSFPSGHATMTTTCAGILFVLIGTGGTGRTLIRIGLAAMIAAMIASRLYLGAHWPSDVMAGFGVGLAFSAAFGFAYGPFTQARAPIDRALLATLATALVIGLGRVVIGLPSVLGFYAPGA